MKVLYVHPSALMYSEVYLRLEPLGLELVAEATRAPGMRCGSSICRSFGRRDLLSRARRMAARGGRLLAQLPGEYPGGRRPGRRASRKLLPRRASFSPAGTAPASPLAKSSNTRPAPSIASSAARAKRSRPDCSRRCATTATRSTRCRASSRLRGAGPPPQLIKNLDDVQPARDLLRRRQELLHRLPRSVRVDRVLARLSVGLHVLQRLDLLRPQLPQSSAPSGPPTTWPACASRACSSSTTWPSSTPSTATPWPTRSSAAASASSITWRRAATCCCATRKSSRAGGGWG